MSERYVMAVKMLVSVEAPSISDAKDLLIDVFGEGELDGFGITCHSLVLESRRAKKEWTNTGV